MFSLYAVKLKIFSRSIEKITSVWLTERQIKHIWACITINHAFWFENTNEIFPIINRNSRGTRIFQRGGLKCQSKGTHQIVMSIFTVFVVGCLPIKAYKRGDYRHPRTPLLWLRPGIPCESFECELNKGVKTHHILSVIFKSKSAMRRNSQLLGHFCQFSAAII